MKGKGEKNTQNKIRNILLKSLGILKKNIYNK